MEFSKIGTSEGELTPAQVKRSITTVLISQILTPVLTQSYTPIMPLLVHVTLEQPYHMVGWIYCVQMIGTFISFAAMQPLLGRYSVRTILLVDYSVRIVAGLLWVLGVLAPLSGGMRLVILFTSRFVFGLTLNSFAVVNPWGAIRVPVDIRAVTVAKITTFVALGIAVGPPLGDGVAAAAKLMGVGEMGQFAVIGAVTVLVSILLIVLTVFGFPDTAVLPIKPPPTAADGEADDQGAKCCGRSLTMPQLLFVLVAWSQLTVTGAVLAGFESTMSLQMYSAYGWDVDTAMLGWLPFALASIWQMAILLPFMMDRLNAPQLGTFALWTALMAIFGINWFNLHQPIPAWWFVIENFFVVGLVTSYGQSSGIIATRVPAHLQVKYQANLALLGQVRICPLQGPSVSPPSV